MRFLPIFAIYLLYIAGFALYFRLRPILHTPLLCFFHDSWVSRFSLSFIVFSSWDFNYFFLFRSFPEFAVHWASCQQSRWTLGMAARSSKFWQQQSCFYEPLCLSVVSITASSLGLQICTDYLLITNSLFKVLAHFASNVVFRLWEVFGLTFSELRNTALYNKSDFLLQRKKITSKVSGGGGSRSRCLDADLVFAINRIRGSVVCTSNEGRFWMNIFDNF